MVMTHKKVKKLRAYFFISGLCTYLEKSFASVYTFLPLVPASQGTTIPATYPQKTFTSSHTYMPSTHFTVTSINTLRHLQTIHPIAIASSRVPSRPRASSHRNMATRTTPQLLLLVLLLSAASPGPSLAEQFVVGDRQHWAPNVNYTVWADQYHFHLGDWLVFYYEKDMYDVVQVNGTAAYESCDASHPIRSYSRGRSYAFQLNETGRHYFICSRGYCWAGMKVSLLVEPPSPPPSEAPSAQPSSANSIARFTCSIWRALTVIALPFSAVWFA